MQPILSFPQQMPSGDPTVGEIIRLYLSLEAKVDTRRAKRAWQERERILLHFDSAYGSLRVSECTKAHLKIWIESNPRLRSDWTRGRWCRTVQRPFNWAVDEMDLPIRNPFKGVRYRKGRRGRPLSDAEFQALARLAGPVFEPVVRFCRLTGARPGEMSQARWDDLRIDEASGTAWITLREHKTSDREDARPRVIGLSRAALELLLTIRRGLGVFPGLEPEHIFVNARQQAWTRNAISLRMRKLRAKAGLPPDAKLYGCRHAFATEAIVNEIELKDVAELLGHSSTRMTEYYVHLAGQHQRLSALADRAGGNNPKPAQDPPPESNRQAPPPEPDAVR